MIIFLQEPNGCWSLFGFRIQIRNMNHNLLLDNFTEMDSHCNQAYNKPIQRTRHLQLSCQVSSISSLADGQRYVYEAIGKTPGATEMVLRFRGMNIIGITLTVGQAYSNNDVQAQDFMGADIRGILHYRLGYHNNLSSWLRLRNAP